jgi:ubiquinone/menaquinone biosynthesis C-methylase UbiE/ADP-ribose pyrophosphatase YjhB (NUDIX family)
MAPADDTYAAMQLRFKPTCPLSDPTRRYRSAEEHLKGFQALFRLASLKYDRSVSSAKMFGKKINPYFVIACIHNHRNQILGIHDGTGEEWYLPGNYLACGENLLECLHRVVTRRTGMQIDVARPFAVLEHTFKSEREQVVQSGVAFLVRARPSPPVSFFRDLAKDWFDVTTVDSRQWYMQNAEVIRSACKTLETTVTPHEVPIDEVDASFSHGWRYELHARVFSPVFRHFASNIIGKRIRKIMHHLPAFGSVLDAACGTDRTIVALSRDFEGVEIYANDLSWEYLRQLAKHDEKRRIIFLNQDLSAFGFKPETRFDVVLFKNTLHHIKTRAEAKDALKRLLSIGRYVVVVDIENPSASNLQAAIWHQYYRLWLKDCGQLFFGWDDFRDMVGEVAGGRRVEFERVGTLKGRYMFAIVHPVEEPHGLR